MRMVMLVGIAAILLMIVPLKASRAQEITAFCGVPSVWETAFSKQNPDCSSGVYLRIDGNI